MQQKSNSVTQILKVKEATEDPSVNLQSHSKIDIFRFAVVAKTKNHVGLITFLYLLDIILAILVNDLYSLSEY